MNAASTSNPSARAKSAWRRSEAARRLEAFSSGWVFAFGPVGILYLVDAITSDYARVSSFLTAVVLIFLALLGLGVRLIAQKREALELEKVTTAELEILQDSQKSPQKSR